MKRRPITEYILAAAIVVAALPCFAQETQGPDEIMLKVRNDGVYYVSAAEIGQAIGLSYGDAKILLSTYGVSLINGTNSAACIVHPAGDGFYFYGHKIDSPYSAFNAYRVIWTNRLDMQGVSATGAAISTNSMFTETRHFEESKYALTGYFTKPESDFWFWSPVTTSISYTAEADLPFNLAGLADTTTNASLHLRLFGATQTGLPNEHHAQVRLNGTVVGDVEWEGEILKESTFVISQSQLLEGSNNLKITSVPNPGIPYSTFYVDSFDVSYSRMHMISGNQLTFNLADLSEVTVSGFSTNSIGVIGLRDPLKPEGLSGFSTEFTNGSWSVSFLRVDGITNYAAFSLGTGLIVDEIKPISSDLLISTTNKGAYVIITSDALASSVARLAEYRTAQGLPVRIVMIEDIYNEFSGGIASPQAIKDFLQYAAGNWALPPKYVLLAGSGSYDYKDYLGTGECIVPVMLFTTASGMFGCDTWYTDFDDNGSPDLPIGRLPALTGSEVDRYLARVKTYEASSTDIWRKTIVLTADDPDSGGDFRATSDSIADSLPSDFAVTKIYVSNANSVACNTMLVTTINDGALLVNYIGHSGVNYLSEPEADDDVPLLAAATWANDMPLLTNSNKLPIVTGMSCVMGRFEIPGYGCLAEELLMAENGGAIAVWSPSGMAYNDESEALGSEFYKQITQNKESILGNVIINASRSYNIKKLPPDTSRIFNLIGEPAVLLKGIGMADDSPFALPIPEYKAWKESLFTTNEQADVTICGDFSDPDGDGLSNMAEYAFGRNPRAHDSDTVFEVTDTALQVSKDYDVVIRFKQRKGLTGINMGLKISTDLASWSEGDQFINHTIKTDDGNGQTETVQYYLDCPENSSVWFVRMNLKRLP